MTNDRTLPGVARTWFEAAHRALSNTPSPIATGKADAESPRQHLIEAIQAFQVASGLPDVALRASVAVPVEALGMAAFACAARPTIGEGLLSLSRYLRLLHPDARLSVETEAGWTQISLILPSGTPLDDVSRSGAEFLLGHLVHRIRQFAEVPVQKVTFRHAPVVYRDAYETHFRAPIEFGREVDSIVVASTVLDVRQPPHDSPTGVRVRRGAMAALRSLPTVGSTSIQVREVILDELIGGIPHMTRVSSRLGMTVPALAAVLKEEGSTFAGLREALLHRLACEYLNDAQLAQAEVAFALGFVDFDVYVSTFTRWSGKTPIEYRAAR